jgi:hypothetical protein
VYIRAFGIDRASLAVLENELQATGKLLYIIDHRENKRKFSSQMT